eukprot:jgi/Mesen1/2566/ME000162S01693
MASLASLSSLQNGPLFSCRILVPSSRSKMPLQARVCMATWRHLACLGKSQGMSIPITSMLGKFNHGTYHGMTSDAPAQSTRIPAATWPCSYQPASFKALRLGPFQSNGTPFLGRVLASVGMGEPAQARTGAEAETAQQEADPRQTTLSRQVAASGVGLHSGEESTVRLLPAAANSGRFFVLKPKSSGGVGSASNTEILNLGDEGDKREDVIPAHVGRVVDTRLSTGVGAGRGRVQTIEHLMSALEGMRVDNVRIEIDGGDEVPLLDGSARDWVQLIQQAGVQVALDGQGGTALRTQLVVKGPVSVHEGDAFVAAMPSPYPLLTYGIDFPQWYTWRPDGQAGHEYATDVAQARTFGILEQLEQLRAAGLIKGGSLDNALVCSMKTGWVNPPLRYADEPCRHKMLDLIGDLALCARPGHSGIPLGHIIAYKASHNLHVKFGLALLKACEASEEQALSKESDTSPCLLPTS